MPTTPPAPNCDSSDTSSDEDLDAYQTPDSTAVPTYVPNETDTPTSEQSQQNVDQAITPFHKDVELNASPQTSSQQNIECALSVSSSPAAPTPLNVRPKRESKLPDRYSPPFSPVIRRKGHKQLKVPPTGRPKVRTNSPSEFIEDICNIKETFYETDDDEDPTFYP